MWEGEHIKRLTRQSLSCRRRNRDLATQRRSHRDADTAAQTQRYKRCTSQMRFRHRVKAISG
ncbi:hypothetical protein E2C01_065853 [Portunus trituberculatus]|uniref:Uncharacterized protein n=1 Tax=Portunus trituberculatus TaxID=210409 RepID=A0A5B7HSZ4_PORTR|nr:hypothetical protein [Portunus trituberculatus]